MPIPFLVRPPVPAMTPLKALAAATSTVRPVPVVMVAATACVRPVGAVIAITPAVLRFALTATAPAAVRLIAPVPRLVIAELTLILRTAFSVRLLALFQLTTSLTKMSPLPRRLTVPWLLRIVTLVVARLVLSVVPVMSPPVAAIVKSGGSINQLPDIPCEA